MPGISEWLENWRRQGQARREAERERQRQSSEERAAAERERLSKERRDARYRQNIVDIIQSGKLPALAWRVPNMPFKFMKSEKLIWLFDRVEYYEHKTRREVKGRSLGANFRVTRGFWLRLGGSHGVPVEKDERAYRGSGPMALTTRHLYFRGQRIFRIPLAKIVSAEALDKSGFVITRDRASAYPEEFVIGNLNFGGKAVNAQFAVDLIHSIESSDVSPASQAVKPPECDLHMPGEVGGYFEDLA